MKKFVVLYLHGLCAGLIMLYLGYPFGFILNYCKDEWDIPFLIVLIVLGLYVCFAIRFYKIFVWINILPSFLAIIIADDIGSEKEALLIVIPILALIIYSLSLIFSKKDD
ncbi:MAG: hypothetical protein J6U37_05685 [Lachnospiraceae bacterium]|nr:hypothetical protein [Lachnospiraceae bacterium]